MKHPTKLLLPTLAFASFLMLVGCGQSGPLYIPGNPSQIAVPPAEAQDENGESQDEDGSSSAAE